MSRGRETWSWLQIVGLVALVSFSLESDSQLICEKSFDIDLRDHNAFINYAFDNTYEVKNAFDRNNKTLIATYFTWDEKVIPPQYLDKGYNWVMVELNKNKFEMVESITLVLRKDGYLKRLSDIEVLISSQMDSEPTRYVENTRTGNISWEYFVECGTTGTATGDTTVNCRKHLMNSNFVAVRRNKETGPCKSPDAYCCLDFAEFKVNLLVQLDHPQLVETSWEENSVANISSSTPSKDCVLPSPLRLQWSLSVFNGTMFRFPESSTKLTIPILKKENSGSYYYEILSSNGSLIFQSNSTKQMLVSYISHVKNDKTEEHYYENNTAILSCSADGGYPHPTQLTTQFTSFSNHTAHMKNDSYYGKEAESSIQLVMNRSMNFQNLTCTLQQPNFSNTTKTFPIIVYYSAGSLIVSNSVKKLNESDLFELSCSTSDFGFPAPTIVITIGKKNATTSYTRIRDKYYGESVTANFSATVLKEWNNVEVTCTLIQHGFPQQSKSISLTINSSESCDTVCVVIIVVSLLCALLVVVVIVLLVKRHSEVQTNEFKNTINISNIKNTNIKKNENNNSKPTADQKTTDLDDIEVIYQGVQVGSDQKMSLDRISLGSHCSYEEFTDKDSDATKSTEIENIECDGTEYANVID